MDTGSTESAPVVESAPRSTEDIAASVINESESQETQASESEASPTETQPVAQQPTQAELSAAMQFLQKQGHKATKDDGKANWIPVKTVEGILERYADQHRAVWTGERSVLENQYKSAQDNLNEIIAGIKGDPKAFLETLSQHDPRYRTFLTPAEKEAIADAADDPEPQLDGTVESLNKLRAWDRRQAKREAEALVKPLMESAKQEQTRLAEEKSHQAIRDRARTQITEAESWPMFGKYDASNPTEFQLEVLKVLQEDTDKKISLRQAYLEVKAKRLETASDPTTVRAQVLSELQTAPRSTSVPRQGPEGLAKPGRRTTEDIAREVLARES